MVSQTTLYTPPTTPISERFFDAEGIEGYRESTESTESPEYRER
jgi:hypothetical protein